jgi:hypothetical protein
VASLLGSALGAFASNSISPISYDPQSRKNLKWLGQKFQNDDAAYQNALTAFNNRNAQTTDQLRSLASQAGTDYNNLFLQNQNYNPLDTYATLRSGNLAALKDWSGQLENAGSRQDKLALAAMGLGGRPDSSYASTLRADRVARAVAPVLGSIFNNLNSETATIGNQRAQNLGNLVNLIGLRTDTPLIGYGMELDPVRALMGIRSGQVAQLGDTVDVARNNTAGYQQKTDTLGKVANSLNAANDALWQNISNAISAYSSLGGGGMLGGLGGMMGGMLGGGGIKTGSAPVGASTFNLGSGYGTPPAGTGSSINAQGYPVMTAPGSYNPWANYSY